MELLVEVCDKSHFTYLSQKRGKKKFTAGGFSLEAILVGPYDHKKNSLKEKLACVIVQHNY